MYVYQKQVLGELLTIPYWHRQQPRKGGRNGGGEGFRMQTANQQRKSQCTGRLTLLTCYGKQKGRERVMIQTKRNKKSKRGVPQTPGLCAQGVTALHHHDFKFPIIVLCSHLYTLNSKKK
jgi:hypothetical protein